MEIHMSNNEYIYTLRQENFPHKDPTKMSLILIFCVYL